MLAFLFAVATATQLPLVEVPATQGTSDTLVVFVSGDDADATADGGPQEPQADAEPELKDAPTVRP